MRKLLASPPQLCSKSLAISAASRLSRQARCSSVRVSGDCALIPCRRSIHASISTFPSAVTGWSCLTLTISGVFIRSAKTAPWIQHERYAETYRESLNCPEYNHSPPEAWHPEQGSPDCSSHRQFCAPQVA